MCCLRCEITSAQGHRPRYAHIYLCKALPTADPQLRNPGNCEVPDLITLPCVLRPSGVRFTSVNMQPAGRELCASGTPRRAHRPLLTPLPGSSPLE